MTYLVKQLAESPKKLTLTQQESVIQTHYNYVTSEISNFISGKLGTRGLIINGPKGGGKTSLVTHTLKTLKSNYHVINGTITAPVLFEMLFKHAKDRHQILVIDDTDVIFNDVEMSDILKAALDGAGKEIHYGKSSSAHLRVNAIPASFKCLGSVIFISNMNMAPEAMTKRHAATLAPIKDRCEYVRVGLTTEWNAIAIRVFYKHNLIQSLNNCSLTAEQKDELVKFVCEHARTDDRWTFRTIQKAISRVALGANWRDAILLGL
jgi:predicted small metal-binding protein